MFDIVKLVKVDDKHYKIKGLSKAGVVNDLMRMKMRYEYEAANSILKAENENKMEFLFHEFFVPELIYIFRRVSHHKADVRYPQAANKLLKNTWISVDPPVKTKVDLSELKKIKWTPRKYQYDFIKKYPIIKDKNLLKGAILGLDQGLGKTFTSIITMLCLKKDLVIIGCPKTLIRTWYEEIKSVFVEEYVPSDEEIWAAYPGLKSRSKNLKYIIVNYERLGRAKEIASQTGKSNIGLIIDEAHNFRNPETVRVKMLFDLVSSLNIQDSLLMSGTPVKGLYAEMAPYLYVLDTKMDDEALETFVDIYNKYRPAAADVIRFRLHSMMFRRLKTQELKLPERTHKIIRVDIPNVDRFKFKALIERAKKNGKELYKELVKSYPRYKRLFQAVIQRILSRAESKNDKKMKKMITDYKTFVESFFEKGVPKTRTGSWDIRMKCYRMEKIIDEHMLNFGYQDLLKDFGIIRKYVRSLDVIALARCVGRTLSEARAEMIYDIFAYNKKLVKKFIDDSSKTIIFTYSKAALNKLEPFFEKLGYKVLTISGDTPDRGEVINKFKTDERYKVFIATYQVASVGLTLVVANTLLYADTPYRPADLDQALDRIYRIGQTRPVFIYYLKLKEPDTIQDRIDKIIKKFRDYIDKIINEPPIKGEDLGKEIEKQANEELKKGKK